MNSYQDDLDRYSKEIEALVQQRAEIDKKIHRLKQVIEGLSAISGIDSDEALSPITEYEHRGLTSGIRQALKFSGQWKTSSAVREMLVASGYNLSGYANASAAINTILNRLHKKGDADRKIIDGVIHFKWAATRNAVKKALADARKK